MEIAALLISVVAAGCAGWSAWAASKANSLAEDANRTARDSLGQAEGARFDPKRDAALELIERGRNITKRVRLTGPGELDIPADGIPPGAIKGIADDLQKIAMQLPGEQERSEFEILLQAWRDAAHWEGAYAEAEAYNKEREQALAAQRWEDGHRLREEKELTVPDVLNSIIRQPATHHSTGPGSSDAPH